MTFDIRTLLFETPFICALFSVVMFAFAIKTRRFRGFWTAGLSFVCLGVGAVLLMLRGVIDDSMSIIVGNVFIISFYFLLPLSVFQFFASSGSKFIKYSYIFIILILISGFYYFTYADFDTASRIILIEAIVAAIFLVFASALFQRRHDGPTPAIVLLLSALFAFRGMYALFRIAWTTGEPQLVALMDAGVVHGMTVVIAQLMVMIVSSAMAYMAVDSLQAELRRSASIDPLTQALNRRAFEAAAEREEARHRRSGSPYAVLICDIDHFKGVNDTHGHAGGDAALRSFSETLRGALRKQDVFARYGGEEFVAVLPDTGRDAARLTAEKLRAAVAEHPVVVDAGPAAPITASFGVAEVVDGADWRARLEAADAALYEAKRDGRNRVAVAA